MQILLTRVQTPAAALGRREKILAVPSVRQYWHKYAAWEEEEEKEKEPHVLGMTDAHNHRTKKPHTGPFPGTISDRLTISLVVKTDH